MRISITIWKNVDEWDGASPIGPVSRNKLNLASIDRHSYTPSPNLTLFRSIKAPTSTKLVYTTHNVELLIIPMIKTIYHLNFVRFGDFKLSIDFCLSILEYYRQSVTGYYIAVDCLIRRSPYHILFEYKKMHFLISNFHFNLNALTF